MDIKVYDKQINIKIIKESESNSLISLKNIFLERAEESESNVRSKYPLIPSENKDYRWIPLNQAFQYLDEEISKDILESTTVRLKKTRMRLRNHFNVTAEIQ